MTNKKHYHSIELSFENGETVVVPAEHIKRLEITGVTENYTHIKTDQTNIQIEHSKSANAILIYLEPEANLDFQPDFNFGYQNQTELFDRLGLKNYTDVAIIQINYSKSYHKADNDVFYVPYVKKMTHMH